MDYVGEHEVKMRENKVKELGYSGPSKKGAFVDRVWMGTFQVEEKGWKGPEMGNSTLWCTGRKRKWQEMV